ncbi:MAG: cation:proton antiporter [Armatimonadetes bacterium]|nr:cation:proton antiporter [Armatimonadota bacterium]
MEGQGWGLMLDLVAILAAAFLLGALMERFRQGAVLGYILAGVILGPSCAGLVKDVATVHSLSELGVSLVLFSIGLEFSGRELRKLGRIGIGGGSLQIFLTATLFAAIALVCRLPWREAVALGAIASLSSTMLVLRGLKETGELDAPHGKACFGVLLVQDIALIPLVLLFTLISPVRVQGAADWQDVGTSLAGVLAGISAFVLIAVLLLPRLLSSRAMARNRELPILLAVTTCIGAAWAAETIGISPALGAFVAGILLAETGFASQLLADVAPLKALFATMFFASIGMLANLHWVWGNLGLVVLFSAVLIVGKTFMAAGALHALRLPPISAAASGLCLAQVGELSFVLLQLALTLGLLSERSGQLATSTAVISLLACPFLVARSSSLAAVLAIPLLKRKQGGLQVWEPKEKPSGHVVVVGYGQAGREACRSLIRAGGEVLVLETNRRLVHLARDAGIKALLADGSQTENLEHAGLEQAKGLIIALSEHRTVSLVASQAKRLAPDLPVVARARYHLFHEEIDLAGADIVVDEESETGRLLGEEMAHHLGLRWENEGS